MKKTSSTLMDPGINKNQCIGIEEKAKLNLTYCLYLEFVHTHCDEIISINKNVYFNSSGLYKFFLFNNILNYINF